MSKTNKIKATVEITLSDTYETSDDAVIGVCEELKDGTRHFVIETIHQHFEDIKPELIYKNIKLED